MADNKPSGYIIKSVVRAFEVLEFLSQEDYIGATELAERFDISKTTAFNILCTLEKIDYIKQSPRDGKYYLSAKILELSKDLEFKLREQAKPYLRELSRNSNETINLVIRTGKKVLYIDKVESSEPLQINTKVGKKEEIYCTAVGKVILAFTRKDERNIILNKLEFKAHTKNTIMSLPELRKNLESIRKKGYAIDNEEFCKGVKCIAGPVFDHTGSIKAAVSITGPQERINEKGEDEQIEMVKKTCKQISKALGYRGEE